MFRKTQQVAQRKTLAYDYAMRDKVLAVLALFAEGGSCRKAREQVGISSAKFYEIVNSDSAIEAQYRGIQASRADMSVDRMHELAEEICQPVEILVETFAKAKASGLTDEQIAVLIEPRDPRCVRVAMDGLRAAAGLYDRKRYGDKITLEHEAKVSLTDAIHEARTRALRPPCDPANVIDAEYTAITDASPSQSSDCLSDAPAKGPGDDEIDPFAP